MHLKHEKNYLYDKIYLDFQSTRLNRSALFMLTEDVKSLSTSGLINL